jgi:hypothetical protein
MQRPSVYEHQTIIKNEEVRKYSQQSEEEPSPYDHVAMHGMLNPQPKYTQSTL